MQLHYNPASPFVRKVMVTAHETGLITRIQLVERMMTPVSPDDNLNSDNPLGKIPTLVLDTGLSLFDSRVICEYLDTLHDGVKLFPQDSRRWSVSCRHALADGILDAAVSVRYETFLRPEEKRWQAWIDNQKEKIRRALTVLEAETSSFADTIDISLIGVACGLGYLDFRETLSWREDFPALTHWYTEFARRPSMLDTAPE